MKRKKMQKEEKDKEEGDTWEEVKDERKEE